MLVIALALVGLPSVWAAPSRSPASREVTVVIPLKWIDAEALARSLGWPIIRGSLLSSGPIPLTNYGTPAWGGSGSRLGGQSAGLYGLAPSSGTPSPLGRQAVVNSGDNSLLPGRSGLPTRSQGLRSPVP